MDRISELKGYFMEADIHDLISELRSPFVDVRQKAADHLAAIGKDAIPPLVAILHDGDRRLACEAAQILADLEGPDGPRQLAMCLEDADPLVRWDSTKALIRLDRGALAPLLKELKKRYGSTRYRDCARDILWMLNQNRRLQPVEQHVLTVLEGPFPNVQAAEAAQAALDELKASGCLDIE